MKNLNKIFNFAIAAIILGYAILFFYNRSQHNLKNKPDDKNNEASKNVDEVVNKYLAQTTEQMEKEKFEKDKALYRVMKQPIKINVSDVGPKPEDIPREQQIAKDVQPVTASEIINAAVFDQEAKAKQEEADKKEYRRQFIENARQGGYEIELSEDNKVIRSTPIRKPSQQDDTVETNESD